MGDAVHNPVELQGVGVVLHVKVQGVAEAAIDGVHQVWTEVGVLQGSSVEVDAGVVVVVITQNNIARMFTVRRVSEFIQICTEAIGVLHADDFGDGIVVVAELRHPIVTVGEGHGIKDGGGQ